MALNMLETQQNILETYQNMIENQQNMLEIQQNMLETYQNMLEIQQNMLETYQNMIENQQTQNHLTFHKLQEPPTSISGGPYNLFRGGRGSPPKPIAYFTI